MGFLPFVRQGPGGNKLSVFPRLLADGRIRSATRKGPVARRAHGVAAVGLFEAGTDDVLAGEGPVGRGSFLIGLPVAPGLEPPAVRHTLTTRPARVFENPTRFRTGLSWGLL